MNCSSDDSQDPAIFGGLPAAPESWLAHAVVSVFRIGLEQSLCTGTLIDRNIVLTAGHCVDDFDQPDFTFIGFSNDPLCEITHNGLQNFRRVTQVIRHPLYSKLKEHDLAMIRFEGIAPARQGYLSLAGTPLALDTSTEILLAGYGKNHDYNAPDTDRHDLKFTFVQPYFGPLAAKSGQPMTAPSLYFDQRNGHGACAGDSGGPALLPVKGRMFQIIGVASRVDPLDQPEFAQQRDVTCLKGIIYVSTLSERAWIEETFTRLRNDDSLRSTPFAD